MPSPLFGVAAASGDVDVTFHLRDARRCNAAAASAGQLRGSGTSVFAKLQTSRFEEVEIMSSSLGGRRESEPRDEC